MRGQAPSSKALRAEAMARSVSRMEASATVAIAPLFAGFRISRVPPSEAGFHSPLMKKLVMLLNALANSLRQDSTHPSPPQFKGANCSFVGGRTGNRDEPDELAKIVRSVGVEMMRGTVGNGIGRHTFPVHKVGGNLQAEALVGERHAHMDGPIVQAPGGRRWLVVVGDVCGGTFW